MTFILLLGFLFGVKHTFEPDHVAAIASLAARSPSLCERLRFATFWGFGHAGTLLVVAAIMIGTGVAIPDALARAFEVLVAAVLVVLGVNVLWQLRSERVHFHAHEHGDGQRHFHAHSHRDEIEHQHVHPASAKALLVGSVHGLSGSAALVLLASQSMRSGAHALAYVTCFGLGSVFGMALFSLVIALPFRVPSTRLGSMARTLEAVLGVVTIALGCWVALSAP